MIPRDFIQTLLGRVDIVDTIERYVLLAGDLPGLKFTTSLKASPKNPNAATHAEYLYYGVLPDDYKAQVHGYLIISGRAWWDFLSYCPGLQPFIIRVTPDEYTKQLRVNMELFWTDYEAVLRKINPDYKREVAA